MAPKILCVDFWGGSFSSPFHQDLSFWGSEGADILHPDSTISIQNLILYFALIFQKPVGLQNFQIFKDFFTDFSNEQKSLFNILNVCLARQNKWTFWVSNKFFKNHRKWDQAFSGNSTYVQLTWITQFMGQYVNNILIGTFLKIRVYC